jgi:sialate O-acetylesterase
VPEHWAGKPAFLNLGRAVDADTTFLNGEAVGATGYHYPPRWYRLPEGILREGTNTLAIRLVSEGGFPGFIPDKDYVLEWDGERIDLRGEWYYRLGVAMPRRAATTFIRWKPLGLYNGMIAPLTSFPIKGIIWYQGESNVGRAEEYAKLFPALIEDWRIHWGREDLPFLYVQLANYLAVKESPGDSQWARLREAQMKALSIPHTGMAVAIDAGEWNDIHPLDKQTVGERLAAAARVVAYDEKNAVGFGPILKNARVRRNRLDLYFDHVGAGLTSCDGQPLRQFAIAGADGGFVWAEAHIRRNVVRVHNDRVSQPKMVRYAWADNPKGANLCNREGLPAAPFRTDQIPGNDPS